MPSRRATWRASSTLSGEQQLPNLAARFSGSRQGHTRRVTPITSTSCSTRSAAATDESTPPLMPTTIRSVMDSLYAISGLLDLNSGDGHRRHLLRARPHDQLDESFQLLSGVIGHLDAPRALVADEAHPRGQRRAKRVFDRTDLGRPPRRPARRLRPAALHVRLGRAHRPRVREDLLAKSKLFGCARQGEKRPRMSHGETAGAQIRLDEVGQLDQPKTVRDRAPVPPDSLSQLLLRP